MAPSGYREPPVDSVPGDPSVDRRHRRGWGGNGVLCFACRACENDLLPLRRTVKRL